MDRRLFWAIARRWWWVWPGIVVFAMTGWLVEHEPGAGRPLLMIVFLYLFPMMECGPNGVLRSTGALPLGRRGRSLTAWFVLTVVPVLLFAAAELLGACLNSLSDRPHITGWRVWRQHWVSAVVVVNVFFLFFAASTRSSGGAPRAASHVASFFLLSLFLLVIAPFSWTQRLGVHFLLPVMAVVLPVVSFLLAGRVTDAVALRRDPFKAALPQRRDPIIDSRIGWLDRALSHPFSSNALRGSLALIAFLGSFVAFFALVSGGALRWRSVFGFVPVTIVMPAFFVLVMSVAKWGNSMRALGALPISKARLTAQYAALPVATTLPVLLLFSVFVISLEGLSVLFPIVQWYLLILGLSLVSCALALLFRRVEVVAILGGIGMFVMLASLQMVAITETGRLLGMCLGVVLIVSGVVITRSFLEKSHAYRGLPGALWLDK